MDKMIISEQLVRIDLARLVLLCGVPSYIAIAQAR